MGAVEEDGHGSTVEADDGQDSRVPWRAEGGNPGHHSRRGPRGSGDADGRREEFVVYVASMGRAGRDDSGCDSVNCVARGYDAAV